MCNKRPPFRHERVQRNDWLDELKTRPTRLRPRKDPITHVTASQPFVIKDNRRDHEHHRSPPCRMGNMATEANVPWVGNESEYTTRSSKIEQVLPVGFSNRSCKIEYAEVTWAGEKPEKFARPIILPDSAQTPKQSTGDRKTGKPTTRGRVR